MHSQNRQLVAILFTDIVGYTAMMQRNEQDATEVMKQYTPNPGETVADHQGQMPQRLLATDILCFIFSSVTEAMFCAIEMQDHFQKDLPVSFRNMACMW